MDKLKFLVKKCKGKRIASFMLAVVVLVTSINWPSNVMHINADSFVEEDVSGSNGTIVTSEDVSGNDGTNDISGNDVMENDTEDMGLLKRLLTRPKLLLGAPPVPANVFYVSSAGDDDTGDGTLSKPYKTIKKAYDSIPSNVTEATIALLSDIDLSGASLLSVKKNINLTVTSADSNGILLSNSPGVYDNIWQIKRGTYKKEFFEVTAGTVTLRNIICDGQEILFDVDNGRYGTILLISGSGTIKLDTNTILRNNKNIGSQGGALGSASVLYGNGKLYVKSNAEIINNIAPRHGAAVTTYNSAKVYIQDDARVCGNGVVFSPSYADRFFGGAAFLIWEQSSLYLEGNATITGNYIDLANTEFPADAAACAIQSNYANQIYIKDNVQVFNNFVINSKKYGGEVIPDNTQANLYVGMSVYSSNTGMPFIVNGEIGENAKIGVTTYDASMYKDVCIGSGVTLKESDAKKFFEDTNNFAVVKDDTDNKLVFAAIPPTSIEIESMDAISSACFGTKATLSEALDLAKNDLTLFKNRTMVPQSAYSFTVNDKVITFNFTGVTFGAGDKVGIQINKNGYTVNEGKVYEVVYADHKYVGTENGNEVSVECEYCHADGGKLIIDAVDGVCGSPYSGASITTQPNANVGTVSGPLFRGVNGTTYTDYANPPSESGEYEAYAEIEIRGTKYTAAKAFALIDFSNVYYVSADGSDETGDGTLQKPYKTIKKAYDSIPSSVTEATIALLSDITLSGTTAELYIKNGKDITLTSAKADGSLVNNSEGDYNGVFKVNRGTNTASIVDIEYGKFTLEQAIIDGGSKPFTATGNTTNNGGRKGVLVYMQGYIGQCDFIMGTNSVLQNNNATGFNGYAGGACASAVIVHNDAVGSVTGNKPCNFYMISNARITGNIAPRHGGAATVYSYSNMYMSDRASIDNNGIVYGAGTYFGGGAILAWGGNVTLSDDAVITNNYVDMANHTLPGGTSACAVQANQYSKIFINDNVRIFDNFSLNIIGVPNKNQSNLYSENSNGSVYITGKLGDTAKIGVTTSTEYSGSIVASGSNYTLTDSDANQFFYDKNNYSILRNAAKNTLVLGSVDKVIVTSQETADCSSVKIELDKEVAVVKNDVTLFFEGKKVDADDYEVSASGKVVTVSFASDVKLPNGAKVGVQINKNGYSINDGAVKETEMTGHDLVCTPDATDKSKVTVTCSREACYYHAHPGTIILLAEDKDYAEGVAYNGASHTSKDCPIIISSDMYEYYLSDGTTATDSTNSGAADTKKAPVEAGEYVVKIPVGNNAAEKSFKVIGPHTHGNWVYSSVDNTIFAKCKDDDYKLKLTLVAENKPYSGETNKATYTVDSEFPVAVTEKDILYYVKNGTKETLTSKSSSGSAGTGLAPVNPGEYVAKITVEGATASVSFAIGKMDQSILPPSALVKNIKTNEVTLIAVAKGHGATSYAVSMVNEAPSNESSWQSDTYFKGLNSGTKYYFFARYAGDNSYNPAVSVGTEITTLSKTILDKEPGGIEPDVDPNNPDDPDIPVIDPYDEEEIYPGEYHGGPEFPNSPKGEVVTTFHYEGREGTVYGPTKERPTEVGKYYYVLRMEDDISVAIKKLPFEIEKADRGPIRGPEPAPDPRIPTSGCPFEPQPTIYTGDPTFDDFPSDHLTKTYTYEGREGTVYGPTKVQPTAEGKYYLVLTIEDSKNKAVEKYPFEIIKDREDGDTGVEPVPGPDDGEPIDPKDPNGPKVPTVGPDFSPEPDVINTEPKAHFPDGYTPKGDVITSYTYVGRADTVYPADGIPTPIKPTLAGKYYLIITVEDDIRELVQKIPFEIKKNPVTVIGGNPTPGPDEGEPLDPLTPQGPKNPGIPYGDEPNSPIPDIIQSEPDIPQPHKGDVVVTYTYVGREDTEYGPSLTFPKKVGKYYLIITVEDDESQGTKKIPFTIFKKSIGEKTGVNQTPGPKDGEPKDPNDPDSPRIPTIPRDTEPLPKVPDIFTGEPKFPDGYTPEGDTVTTYTYEGREGTVYGPTETEPTAIGKYYLIITVEDDNNKVVEKIPFEIVKKVIGDDTGVEVVPGPDDGEPIDPDKPDGPKVPQVGPDFSPSPDIFKTSPEPDLPDGYTPTGDKVVSFSYEGRNGTEYGPTEVKPTLVGKYYLIITVEDDLNMVIQKIPFEIVKTDGGEPQGVTPTEPQNPKKESGDEWNPNPELFTGDPELPDGYTPEGDVVKNYYYEGREGTVYGPSKTKPLVAGKYYYVITIEDKVKIFTKKLPFEIYKRAGEEIVGVTPVEDPKFPYNPSGEPPFGKENPNIFTGTPGFPEDEPVVGDLVTTFRYEGREGTVYGPSEEKPTAIGKYYLIIRIEDDAKWAEKKIPFEIEKITTGTIVVEPQGEPTTVPADPDGDEPFDNPVPTIIKSEPTLSNPKQGNPVITYTYVGRDGTVYPDNGIPTTVKPTKGGKYFLIITIEDDINKATKKVPFEITRNTDKEPTGYGPSTNDPKIPYDPEKPVSPEPDIITIEPEGPKFDGGVGDVVITYTYEGRDGTDYPKDGQPTTIKPVSVGKYNLIVTIFDDVNIYTKKYPFEITKGDRPAPALISESNPDGIGAYNEIVKGMANGFVYNLDGALVYQYSLDNGASWKDVLAGSTEITDLAVGTVLLREKENESYKASESLSLKIGEGVYVELESYKWNSFLNTITFGKFFKKTQTVSVKNIKEEGTAVKNVEYYISSYQETSTSLDTVTSWKSYSNLGVKLNPTVGYVVYFKVNDKYGEYTYLSTDGVVIDSDAPVVIGIENGKVYETSISEITFMVEDKYLDKVSFVQNGKDEVILTGISTTVPSQKKFVLSVGNYEKVIAIDKSGNKTEILDIKVVEGLDKPIVNGPYKKPNQGEPLGNPEEPTVGDGPYVFYSGDTPTSDDDPIIEFDYPDDEPDKVDILKSDPEYEIFLGPLDADGEPTVGPLENYPVKVPGGTPFYVRKKAKEPYGPSEFTTNTIPEAAKTMVYLEVYPAGAGKVSIDGENVNHKRVYTGQNISLEGTATGDFEFSEWKNKKTNASVGKSKAIAYETKVKNGTEYIVAIFSLTGDDIVSIPEDASLGGVITKDFVYDGTEKEAISISDIDANVILEAGSVIKAINAGTYTFTLSLKSGYRWEDGTTEKKSYIWHVNKAETEIPTVSYSSANTYINYTSALGTESREISVKRGKTGAEREYSAFLDGKGIINPTGDGEPVSDSNPLEEGTYFIKTLGDENHKDSAWVSIVVGHETPEIITFGPTEYGTEPIEVTTHTTITSTDDVKKIIVRYRKKGTNDWINSKPDAPVSTRVDVKFPNEGDTLLPDTEYEYQTIIVMEGSTEAESDDYEIAGDISSFRTKKVDGNETGTIITEIYNDSETETKEVMIAIEKGNTLVASEVLLVAAGSMITSTPVTNLEDGVYNIVLRTKDGCFVETRSVTISNGNSRRVSFVILSGKIKSVVEIKPGSPATAVEGLANIITEEEKEKAKNGELSVEVKLTVEMKNASEAEDGGKLALLSASQGKDILLYLDINLFKIRTILDPLSGRELSEETENIGLVNKGVLEIAVPYDTVNNSEITVFRYHDGKAECLTEVSERLDNMFFDGTYFVGDGYVFIYASGFSTYGISSKTKNNPDPDNDPDPDDDPNGNIPGGGSGNGSGNGGKNVKPPKTDDPLPQMPDGVRIVMICSETEEEKKKRIGE